MRQKEVGKGGKKGVIYGPNNYIPLQNLKEHTKNNYIPWNTSEPYCHLITFRSSHCHTEHNLDTHNTTLTFIGMVGQTYYHLGK